MVGDEVNAEDQQRWLAEAGELERIAYVRTERWITYPRAAAILDQMQRLLDHPRNSRMPSLLIIGEAGIGKTQLAIETGRNLLPHFPDGVWIADLAPLARCWLTSWASIAVAAAFFQKRNFWLLV